MTSLVQSRPGVCRIVGWNIKTEYDPKPGRVNGPEPFPFDWEAYSDEWDEGDPVGFGSTEEAAIADLLTQVEERAA